MGLFFGLTDLCSFIEGVYLVMVGAEGLFIGYRCSCFRYSRFCVFLGVVFIDGLYLVMVGAEGLFIRYPRCVFVSVPSCHFASIKGPGGYDSGDWLPSVMTKTKYRPAISCFCHV